MCSGGDYPGGTVLHWPAGAGGKGALLSGDVVQVVQDKQSVSFMWSFPNIIRLSAPRVEGVVNSLKPYKFDRIHGAFAERTIWSDGKDVLERSAARYLKMIRGDGTYELQDFSAAAVGQGWPLPERTLNDPRRSRARVPCRKSCGVAYQGPM